jgi:subtilisin family serine protease
MTSIKIPDNFHSIYNELYEPDEIIKVSSSKRVINTSDQTSDQKISWRKKYPYLIAFVAFLLISIVIIAIVVPIVCTIKGCSPSISPLSPEPLRLIVSFADIAKTAKSIIPPVLHVYFEELALPTSGIIVVTINDPKILIEIRRILERQPDLINLLQDNAFPVPDPQINKNTRRTLLQSIVPNDPLWSSLWNLRDVDALSAWNITQGSRDVIIAIIDTGCDVNHPDLKDNLWVNLKESVDNIDNDGNGYIDDINGFNFAGGFRNPQDIHSHGTHCAGIIGAIGNNSKGIVGIAPNIKFMCLKVADPNGFFYTSHILSAYDYALRMGAHIVSCSFGPSGVVSDPSAKILQTMQNETRFYESAIMPMQAKGMLIVSAAGNENSDLNLLIPSGASYNPCTIGRNSTLERNTLCVMALGESNKRWDEVLSNNQRVGSNFGTQVVDLAAPGRMILSTVPPLQGNNYVEYDFKTGTSMATPLVAGAAALVLSVLGSQDGNYYKGDIARQLILDTSDRTSTERVTKTNGRLNVGRAVKAAIAFNIKIRDILPMAYGWNKKTQGAQAYGFQETYYEGAISSLGDQDWSTLAVDSVSIKTGNSFFGGFKRDSRQQITLIVNSTFFAPVKGVYGLRVRSNASMADVIVVFGYQTMTLNELQRDVMLRVMTSDFYQFELRYRNPYQIIDLTMNTPLDPQYKYLPDNFLIAQLKPSLPRIYNGPNSGLSSVFQVLYKPVIVPYPLFNMLSFEEQYEYTSIWEDISYSTPTALNAAFFIDRNVSNASIIGMVHTRLLPKKSMIFVITCQNCMVYINELPVIDSYGLSRRSSCITFNPSVGAIHDLVIKFSNNGSGIMILRWVACDSIVYESMSVKSLINNPLFWMPKSGVAGYVGGVQCDIWPSNISYGLYNSPAPSGEPYIKFRLPSMLSGSASRISNPLWSEAPCQSNKTTAFETFDRRCQTSFSFRLQDIHPDLINSITSAIYPDHPFIRIHVRCWTYIKKGMLNGIVRPRAGFGASITALGGQRVFIQAAPQENVKSVNTPLAPINSTLNGYYQLLVYEVRNINSWAFIGLIEGGIDIGNNIKVNYIDTLLPIMGIPLVGSSRVGAQSIRLVQFANNPRAFYEAQQGLSKIVMNRLDWFGQIPKIAAIVQSRNIGLSGTIGINSKPNQSGLSRYTRVIGFMSASSKISANTIVTLRVRSGNPFQCLTFTFGEITIVNGNECPARVVNEYLIQMMWPGGVIRAELILKSIFAKDSVVLDVRISSAAVNNGAFMPINANLWYSEVI